MPRCGEPPCFARFCGAWVGLAPLCASSCATARDGVCPGCKRMQQPRGAWSALIRSAKALQGGSLEYMDTVGCRGWRTAGGRRAGAAGEQLFAPGRGGAGAPGGGAV
ncbi:MAG: DUF1289 domain-containing protein [Diaphorobacter sp.]|nr:DUF1289 domain-containing protein [Diaphorobacter sp.]